MNSDEVMKQKDLAVDLAQEIYNLTEIYEEIDYVTVLHALSNAQIKLTDTDGEFDLAGAVLVDVIAHDFEIPDRPRDFANIFTTWIGQILSISEKEALVVHNYIDDHKLIDWDSMNSIEMTQEMDYNFREAIEIAVNALHVEGNK